MDEMKSAFERAMERADSLGKASEEDRRKWKYRPEGERLAAEYLRDETDLSVELAKFDDEARAHVVEGAQAILVRNLGLPKDGAAKSTNKKAMEAIKELKRDKVAVENVFTKMRRIFNHYEQEGEQQRRQAYEEVKREVEGKIRQAMQQQMGASAPERINVEAQPQFQQEWRHVVARLDSQYVTLLEEYKQEMLSIP
ncbi:MAG: hypothetical protein V3S51_07125 [Dehalococcoidia bacterium]